MTMNDVVKVDCRGLQCPAPILRIAKTAKEAKGNPMLLEVLADDGDFPSDLEAWCRTSRAVLHEMGEAAGAHRAVVGLNGARPAANTPPPLPPSVSGAMPRRPATVPPFAIPAAVAQVEAGADLVESLVLDEDDVIPELHAADPATFAADAAVAAALAPRAANDVMMAPGSHSALVPRKNQCTLLVLRNDFESLMAALLVATASAAQGMEVVMFYSFWGVNLLRGDRVRKGTKEKRVGLLQRLMKMMMPKGPHRQRLSKMHMGGIGTGMMEHLMRKNKVMDIGELMQTAVEQNVKFVVCTMSMGIMGIQKRDLMDLPNMEYAGVTLFVEQSRQSSMSLVF